MPELKTLMTGISFGEQPRWHENRLWFSELTLKLTCRGRCESLLSRETVMRPRSGAAPGSAAAKTPGTLKHPKRSRPVTTE